MDKGIARVNVKTLSNALTYIVMNLVRSDDESRQLKAAYAGFEDATFALMKQLLCEAHPGATSVDTDRAICEIIEHSVESE